MSSGSCGGCGGNNKLSENIMDLGDPLRNEAERSGKELSRRKKGTRNLGHPAMRPWGIAPKAAQCFLPSLPSVHLRGIFYFFFKIYFDTYKPLLLRLLDREI